MGKDMEWEVSTVKKALATLLEWIVAVVMGIFLCGLHLILFIPLLIVAILWGLRGHNEPFSRADIK